jgi:hypothetical protein
MHRDAELVSAPHMLSDHHTGYLFDEIPKQVRDNGGLSLIFNWGVSLWAALYAHTYPII